MPSEVSRSALWRPVAALAVLAFSASPALAQTTHGNALAAVGPVSPVHPFPLWYQDGNDFQWEPCLDTTPKPGFPGTATRAPGYCGIPTGPGTGLNPTGVFDGTKPVVFPTNFPGTVVYGSVTTELPLLGNPRGLVYSARLIGTFNRVGPGFDPGTPQVFSEFKFSTNVSLPAGGYSIEHPYGQVSITTTAAGDICDPAIQNVPGRAPCLVLWPADPLGAGFGGVLVKNLGVDPVTGQPLPNYGIVISSAAGPPPGYAGDGGTRVPVRGSPMNPANNFVRIVGVGVGTPAPGFTCTNGLLNNCVESNGNSPGTGLVVTGKLVDPAHSPPLYLVTLPPGPLHAGVPVTVTVNVIDVNGNPKSGYNGTATIALSDPRATTVPASPILFVGGFATFSLTPMTAGALDITLTDTVTPSLTATVSTEVLRGPPAIFAAASGNDQSFTVGLTLPAPLVVRVTDAFDNGVPGEPVTFSALATGAAVNPASATTAADGTASTTATLAATPGVQTFRATSGTFPAVDFTETAVPGTPATVSVTGLPANVTAGAAISFSVAVLDQFGNVVTGFNGGVSFTSTDAAAALPAATTLAGGTGTFNLTFKTAGSRTVTATIATTPTLSGTSAATTVAPGPPSSVAAVSGGGQTGVVGSALALPLVVRVQDAFANGVPNVAATFTPPAGGLVTAPGPTAADGTTSVIATLPTTPGPVTYGASVAGVTQPASFAETGVPGAPASVTLAGVPASTGAGSSFAVTVRAFDAFGNACTNFNGGLAITSSDTAATLPGGASFAAGVTSPLPVTLRTAGVRSVTATVVGAPTATSTANITVTAGAAANLALVSGNNQTGTVGTVLAQPFVVKVTDAFGNPVAGTAVTFVAPATGSVTAAAPTAADGTTSARGTLGRTAGAQTFTASSGTLAGSPVSFSATATAGAAASIAAVSGGGQSGTVGTALAQPFVVRVRDAFANAVPGATVTFAAPATGSVSVAPPTAADGTTSARGTLPTSSGAATFTSSATGVATPASFAATATPGAPTALTMTGLPATAIAGVATPVQLAAFDDFGNACTNFDGAVTFSSNDPGFAPPAASLTLGVGTAIVTLVTAGSRTVTAAIEAVPAATATLSTTVVAGSASALALVSGTGQTGTVGAALAQPFVVKVTDVFGNAVSGTTVTFAAPATGSIAPASTATLADGTASATGTLGRTAGAQTFTASAAGLTGSPLSLGATAAPGAPASLTVTGLPLTVAAGVTSTLSVTALDSFGNTATGSSAALTVTSTDPAAVFPAAAALAAGVASLPVTLKTTGARSVTVSIAGVTPVVLSTTVTPAAISTIAVVSSPASATVGSAAGTATVVVKDTLGNVVPGATVTFAATSGGGIAPTSVVTDADGRASATPTVGTAAGSYTFTASVAGIPSASFSVTAVADVGHHFVLTPHPTPSPVLDCGCFDVAAQLVDAFGNSVSGALGPISATASGSATLSPPAALQPDGSALLHVCDARPEQATVSIGAPGTTIASASVDLTWTLGPADATASSFTIDTPTLVAWSGHGTITVQPKSACGNPIPAGQRITLSLVGPGTLSQESDLPDGTHTASLSVTPCPAAPTTQVRARVLDTATGNAIDLPPLDVAIRCVVPSAANTAVALGRSGSVPMCNDAQRNQVPVTITPKDDAGVSLGAGNSVTLAMDGLSGGAVQDNGDGTYAATFSAASCSPAVRQLTVRVNGVDIARPDMTLAFPCAPVDPAASGVAVTGAPAVADGSAQVGIAVAATNTCGEPARGRPVQLSADLGALAAAAGTTDDAGAFATTLTSLDTGDATVTAVVDGVALAPARATFTAPPAPHRNSGGCGTGGEGSLAALLAAVALARRPRAAANARKEFHVL